jgi:hypothetical protein
MGPPPRSLANDAHDCIMDRMPRASTEYKVVGQRSPDDGRLASDHLVRCWAGRHRLTWMVDRRRPAQQRIENGASGNRTCGKLYA